MPQHLYEPDCVFCEIAAGELPARFLYADGTVLSFLDIAPATRGHALVVPRAHRCDLWEIHDDELVAVSLVVRKVAVALREVLAAPGMWLHHVSGAAAGQDVVHYHLHLIPRYDDAVQPAWVGRGAVAPARGERSRPRHDRGACGREVFRQRSGSRAQPATSAASTAASMR